MGMAADHLVRDRRGDVGQVEPALLLGDRGVEEDLQQHVAELALQVVVALAVRSEAGDRVDELVRLLDRVPGERRMRLLAVPRAFGAQAADDAVEADELAADRRARCGT